MKEITPQQHTGAKSDTSYTITAKNEKEAKQLFEKARQNLLHVNNWQELAGSLSATFELIDARGNKVQRAPQKGDYFKIDLPAPGNESGRGGDWVQVEAMEEDLKDPQHAYTTLRVRAAKAPAGQPDSSSHFFAPDATSTFSVERSGNKITASVRGRNEKPNTEPAGWFNKIRNFVIGFMAMLGMNKPQWKALVKGILEKEG